MLDLASTSESRLLRDRIADLGRPPEMGEIFRILQGNAADVRVLEFVVTDVDDSAGQMRTLLSSNGILPLDTVVVTPPVSRQASSPTTAWVFYLEGTEPEVNGAIADFNQLPAVVTANDYGVLAEESPLADSEPTAPGEAFEAPAEQPASGLAQAGNKASEEPPPPAPATVTEDPAFAPPVAAKDQQSGDAKKGDGERREAGASKLAAKPLDELSAALEQAKHGEFYENAARMAKGELNEIERKQVTDANGLVFDLPPESAAPVLNYLQTRSGRGASEQYSQLPRQNTTRQRSPAPDQGRDLPLDQQ